jgi:ferric-dicitrate binding protein FerR (iron transport regulator)
MELDDQAGARLRALGEHERSELGQDAQGRIAERIAHSGPGLVRRARRTRRALQLATGLCVIGLAWGASRWLVPDESVAHRVEPQPARGVDRGVDGKPPPALAPAARTTAARACELRDGTEPARVTSARGQGERIELGVLGALLAEPGGALWLDARDPCRVRARLQAGAVIVHAADLGGGELRVTTDRGDVVVHGTLFRVARNERELTVEVAEGKVSVVQHGQVLVPAISAGQRARLIGGQPAVLEPLTVAERGALSAQLAQPSADDARTVSGDASSGPAGAPTSARTGVDASSDGTSASARTGKRSAGELVHEADALWRQGQLERARARYREAGAQPGPTAEAAWLALARRELSAGRATAAQHALREYGARFPRGALVAEAAGIAFRAALERGDRAAARQQAELLVRRYRATAQAEAAARWLAGQPKP